MGPGRLRDMKTHQAGHQNHQVELADNGLDGREDPRPGGGGQDVPETQGGEGGEAEIHQIIEFGENMFSVGEIHKKAAVDQKGIGIQILEEGINESEDESDQKINTERCKNGVGGDRFSGKNVVENDRGRIDQIKAVERKPRHDQIVARKKLGRVGENLHEKNHAQSGDGEMILGADGQDPHDENDRKREIENAHPHKLAVREGMQKIGEKKGEE